MMVNVMLDTSVQEDHQLKTHLQPMILTQINLVSVLQVINVQQDQHSQFSVQRELIKILTPNQFVNHAQWVNIVMNKE